MPELIPILRNLDIGKGRQTLFNIRRVNWTDYVVLLSLHNARRNAAQMTPREREISRTWLARRGLSNIRWNIDKGSYRIMQAQHANDLSN